MTRVRVTAWCAALALTACVGAPVVPGDGDVAGAPIASLDGTPARIDLLARQFLPAGKRPTAGYAEYCYLVFADQAKASSDARKAAAAAYLDLFSDVVEASKSASPEHMAVIMAPVKDAAAAAALRKSRSLEAFLHAYDHDRASVLVAAFARAGKRLPSVSVVAYPTPLEGADALALADAWVVPLTDPASAEDKFLRLRDALVVGAKSPEKPRPRLVMLALAIFREIGIVGSALPDLKL
jgi:hypothetical protein